MNIEEMEGMVKRHEKDLYFGDGRDNPPITGRLLLLEDAIARFARNSSKIVWLVVATLIVALINLLIHTAAK
jgi:hypothetical protein